MIKVFILQVALIYWAQFNVVLEGLSSFVGAEYSMTIFSSRPPSQRLANVTQEIQINITKPHRLAIFVLLNGYYIYKGAAPPYQMDSGIYEAELNRMNIMLHSVESIIPENEDGRRCLLTTAQRLMDNVNSRPDLLPNYEIELHIYNGDLADSMTPQLLLEFLDNFRGKTRVINPFTKQLTFMSPLFVGPSSPWTGVQGFSNTRLIIEKTMLQSFGLANFYYINLSQFGRAYASNAFVSQHTQINYTEKDVSAIAIITFLKSGLVPWREIGIITNDGWGGDTLLTTLRIARILQKNGLKLVDFQIGVDYVQLFSALRKSRARIIYLPNADSGKSCQDIFCGAYNAGVRPPNYVLLFSSFVCFQYLADDRWMQNLAEGKETHYQTCPISAQIEWARWSFFSESAVVVNDYVSANFSNPFVKSEGNLVGLPIYELRSYMYIINVWMFALCDIIASI